MHISSFVCTLQTHVRIYYHADIMYITVYCVSHTHTHTKANTHAHTHWLPLCIAAASVIAHAQCWTTCATDRSASQELRLTAASTSLLNSRRPCNGFFLYAHTHTHAHTQRLQNSMQTRCKFHASQNAYVLHVHACNKRHWTRTKNVYHDMNTCANIGHT
jgi:hypothetical protein